MMAQQLRCGTAKVHQVHNIRHKSVFDGHPWLTRQPVLCRSRQLDSMLSSQRTLLSREAPTAFGVSYSSHLVLYTLSSSRLYVHALMICLL
jgi:hypothetical protein